MNQLTIPIDALSNILQKPVTSIEQLGQGGNSRVGRVRCRDGTEYVAKAYLQRTISGLNRLDVEYSALTFLWSNGVRCIPEPLFADRVHQIAVYEYVDGNVPAAGEIGADEIQQAVHFAGVLRDLRERDGSRNFPPASEAFFSLKGILGNIDERLLRLRSAPPQGASYDALCRFLSQEFTPALGTLRDNLTRKAGPDSLSKELGFEQRTLSPSDFGFHNGLRRLNGELVFLDFEYFGWDDPAKMIADFVLHPGMELDGAMKGLFVRGMLDCFSSDVRLPDRLEMLYPLFGLKWCMIMLNEFVPKDLQRREFAAHAPVDRVAAQMRQLDKARAMLKKIVREAVNFPYTVPTA